MGQALYRKYRSKSLSEIVGQEHITKTLQNALKNGAISHAYLFTGPRGVGKTSIARILAHEVNGFKYDGSNHLDIIEIDAASNRRIEEIRNLREHISSAPAQGKYKVFIIDEVHMLTKEAFNALLKTLEEPPAHVIFILATTEAHKLPETIISRTQRYTFKPVNAPDAVQHLRFIAESENITADDEALQLIADHGQGSFRDSISLFDQVAGGKATLTTDEVRATLGVAPQAAIDSLITAIELGSAKVVLQTLEDLRSGGYHSTQLAKQLAASLRLQLIEGTYSLPRSVIIDLLAKLIDVPASHDPDIFMELVIINSLPAETEAPSPQPAKAKPVTPLQPTETSTQAPKVAAAPDPEPEPVIEDLIKEPEEIVLTDTVVQLDEEKWQQALNAIKNKHNTLYSVARMATPSLKDDKVTLAFAFPFHQKRANESKNKALIGEILGELLGMKVEISCIIETSQKMEPLKPAKNAKTDNIDTISNIFGGAEMLE